MPLDQEPKKDTAAKDDKFQKMSDAIMKAQLDKGRKIKTEHTVKKDETLSHIALKHYGSAVKEKWMVIYEANKDVIGDNPTIIVPGQILKIPEL